MELITINLGANDVEQYRKAGAYMEIIDAAYPVDIDFNALYGGSGPTIKQGLSGLYMRKQFGGFTIKNGATAQIVQLLVCDDGEDGGSRRQPGLVRVVDQSADKTKAGFQFVGSMTNQDVLTKVNIAGIKATTKTVIIKRVLLNSPTAGSSQLLILSGDPTINASIVVPMANNKLGTGAACLAASVKASSDVMPGAKSLGGMYLVANSPQEFPLTSPIVLPAGYILVANGVTADRAIGLIVDFEEE